MVKKNRFGKWTAKCNGESIALDTEEEAIQWVRETPARQIREEKARKEYQRENKGRWAQAW